MEIHSIIKRAFASFQDYRNDSSPQMDLLYREIPVLCSLSQRQLVPYPQQNIPFNTTSMQPF